MLRRLTRLPGDEATLVLAAQRGDRVAPSDVDDLVRTLDRDRLPALRALVPDVAIADDSNNKLVLAVGRL